MLEAACCQQVFLHFTKASQDEICVNWFVNKWSPTPSCTPIHVWIAQHASVFLQQQSQKVALLWPDSRNNVVSCEVRCFTHYATQMADYCAVCVDFFFRHKHGGRAKALQAQSGLQAAALSRLQVRLSRPPWFSLEPWSSLCFIPWRFNPLQHSSFFYSFGVRTWPRGLFADPANELCAFLESLSVRIKTALQ